LFILQEEVEDNDEINPKIVIDPAKAFCQRMKFVVRLKKRMKEFKARKLRDAMESSDNPKLINDPVN